MYDEKDPHFFADNGLLDIIGIIRHLRNELIREFLKERNLMEYWACLYKSHELSGSMRLRIYTELRQLLSEPVDVQHYAPLVDTFRRTGSVALTGNNDTLFFDELEAVLHKFVKP